MKTMLLISKVAMFIGTMSIGCDQTSQHLIHPILEVTDQEPEDTVTDQDVPEPEPIRNTGGCIDNILITNKASKEQLEELEKCLTEENREMETPL